MIIRLKMMAALLVLLAMSAQSLPARAADSPAVAPAEMPRANGMAETPELPPMGITAARPGPTPTTPPLARPEIYGRSGPALGSVAKPKGAAEDGGITLNFVDAEVDEVVGIVLGDALGLSYAIDAAIDRKITARTIKPLSRDAALATLESILQINGLAIVKAGGVYQVVTLETAGARLPTAQSGGELGFGLHVLPLRYVGAAEIAKLLEPYVPEGRTLKALSSKNVIIFSGTAAEARDLQGLADLFDVDWLRGRTFALLPIANADAKNIARELSTVFGVETGGPLEGVIAFLPIERLNAVLAMSSEPNYVAEAKAWVERLDRGAIGAGRRTYVYAVQNARARDLARTLQSLYGGTARTTTVPEAEPYERPQIDRSLKPMGETAGIGEPRLDELRATQASGPAPPAAFETKDGVRIVADDGNNALLISANREQYQEIESVLRQLDIVPLQVLIEATIAEVTLTDELRYGLQWFFKSGDTQGTLSNRADGAVSSTFPGFSFVLNADNADIVLDMLAKLTDVRVVSSPTLLVLDNELATLQVGDEVPIATRSSRSVNDPNAPIVNQIEFRETGVILEVTPRVNSSGLIMLDIAQEVSDVVQTTTSSLDSPTIRQRRLASAIVVQSGESVVLGGLIRDGTRKGSSGVPILSDIPIIGSAFKSSADGRDRTELLVLITPKIARGQADARALTAELQERLQSLKPLQERIEKPPAVGWHRPFTRMREMRE